MPAIAHDLPTIPGGWTTRDFVLAGRTLRVTLPASPDAFLDDPDVLAANRRDDYMPYWSYLWPTSLETAVAVLTHEWNKELAYGSASILPALRKGGIADVSDRELGSPKTDGLGSPSYEAVHALEIGAGIALTGLAALACGIQVTFSDYDRRAIDLALFNARENLLDSNAEGLLLDWRQPINRQFPLIFGCDVIYETQNHRPILGLLEKMLAKDGQCWITDPGRYHADAFVDLLTDSPFNARHQLLIREPYPGRPAGTTNLWVLTWK
jgi:2-polyprenyl-3-methyl-5-hydroxy-6-metoxy-1,4-benzoquinol methylase